MKIYTIKILSTVAINFHPPFQPFFVNVNFIIEEMVCKLFQSLTILRKKEYRANVWWTSGPTICLLSGL